MEREREKQKEEKKIVIMENEKVDWRKLCVGETRERECGEGHMNACNL